MPIDTEEVRKRIAALLPDDRLLFGSEIQSAALMMQKASLQVQLEILDELRAIRVAVANPPRTVDPCDGAHDVVGGLSPYCLKCGASL